MPFRVQGLQDVIVVVTRWYGGIHLSSDRFKDINYVRGRGCLFLHLLRFHECADIMLCAALQVARAALEQGGFLDEAEDGKKGGSGAGKGGKGGGGNANKAKKR